MSDDDQRKALIVENNKRYTDWTIPQLQAMTNQELVQMGLEWFAKPTMKGYVRDYIEFVETSWIQGRRCRR